MDDSELSDEDQQTVKEIVDGAVKKALAKVFTWKFYITCFLIGSGVSSLTLLGISYLRSKGWWFYR